MKRNVTLDYMRGLAILIVILGHALLAAWDGVPKENGSYQLVINCQMILLMFISGIAGGFSFPSEKPGKFLIKKITRLLIPYIIWAEIYAMINAIACEDVLEVDTFIRAIYASDFWFLRYLFVLYVIWFGVNVVFNFLGKRLSLQEKQSELLLMGLLILSIGGVYVLSKLPIISQSISIWFYVWFLLGYIVYTKKSWFQKNIVVFEGIGTLSIDAMVIVIIATMAGGTIPAQVQGAILVLGICYASYFMCKYLPKWFIERMTALGKNTLPIYAIHWCLFFAPLYNNLTYRKLIAWDKLPYVVNVCIIFGFLLLTTLICIWIFRKWKVTRVLLMGESK